MDKYICSRCETELTYEEHKNNVCLCGWCKALVILGDYSNPFQWDGINNIDNILETKRGM